MIFWGGRAAPLGLPPRTPMSKIDVLKYIFPAVAKPLMESNELFN